MASASMSKYGKERSAPVGVSVVSRDRMRNLIVICTLALSLLAAYVGVNVGAVAPQVVPAAMSQEAEAHGTHEFDPCIVYTSPVRRLPGSTLIEANGGSHACRANSHAAYHNITQEILVLVREFTRSGKLKRVYWKKLVAHRGKGAIGQSLTVRPVISCLPGTNRYMSRARSGVNGNLGPRYWTYRSYPVRITC